MGQEQSEFADFYRDSRDPCLRAVTAVTGDRERAEEQVAEAFTRAWTSWHKVRGHAVPRAWVVRTALNLGVSWWRQRRREVPLADYDAAAPDRGPIIKRADLPASSAIEINPRAIPRGSRLSIGYYPGHIRMLLISDRGHLACARVPFQPVMHIHPVGTPIHR